MAVSRPGKETMAVGHTALAVSQRRSDQVGGPVEPAADDRIFRVGMFFSRPRAGAKYQLIAVIDPDRWHFRAQNLRPGTPMINGKEIERLPAI